MKLTLKQKRQIVERFKAGDSICTLIVGPIKNLGPVERVEVVLHIARDTEQVIRDYMNGKFKLAKEKR